MPTAGFVNVCENILDPRRFPTFFSPRGFYAPKVIFALRGEFKGVYGMPKGFKPSTFTRYIAWHASYPGKAFERVQKTVESQ